MVVKCKKQILILEFLVPVYDTTDDNDYKKYDKDLISHENCIIIYLFLMTIESLIIHKVWSLNVNSHQ